MEKYRDENLIQTYRRDQRVWDRCADSYEKHVVNGYPDIKAYEELEEDLLDRILQHLLTSNRRKVSLYDIGCGSGRLHLPYGLKIASENRLPLSDSKELRKQRLKNENYRFDRFLFNNLMSVSGIDISSQMINNGKQLDDNRAVPVQLAILDTNNLLQGFFKGN